MITITLNEAEHSLFARCDQCSWNRVFDSEIPGIQTTLFEDINDHACVSRPKVRTLNQWVEHIGSWAMNKGWDEKERGAAEWIALAHTELSEAFEAYRVAGEMHSIWYGEDGKPEGYLTELVDTFIRLCHNVSILNADFDSLVEEKMAYNEKRPYRHGNKHA